MAVRRANHYTKQAVIIVITYVKCVQLIDKKCILNTMHVTNHIVFQHFTSFLFKSFLSFFLPSLVFALPQIRTYTPVLMSMSQMPVGETRLWTRILDKNTKAGLHESVARTVSQPPPKATQDRIPTKDTLIPMMEIKIPDSSENRSRAAMTTPQR